MKNIHILPTDKPSRLHFDGNLFLSPNYQDSKTINSIVEGKHIYITSDEEIKQGELKKGDWYYSPIHNKLFQCIHNNECFELERKIILTTDVDLIQDGVQKIDDKFLEWFVNNPRCEEVEVVKGFDDGTSYGYNFLDYKIIIPTEEPKQTVQEYEQQGLEKYSNELVEPKQDYTSKHIEHCHNIAMESLVKEPKQETINEVAERLVKEHPDFKLEGYTEYQNGRFNGIIEGIEWQQEQDKKMYSDEEVLEIFEQFKMNLPFHYEFLVKEALQQLKKK